MYGTPPCSKYSCTVTMFGWLSEPPSLASRRNRIVAVGSVAQRPASSFSATARSRSA